MHPKDDSEINEIRRSTFALDQNKATLCISYPKELCAVGKESFANIKLQDHMVDIDVGLSNSYRCTAPKRLSIPSKLFAVKCGEISL